MSTPRQQHPARPARTACSPGDPDDYLLPSELAKEWKIRVRTLEQWRYRRTGPPYVKIGGRVRYSRKAATQWAAAQAVEPQGAA